MAERIVHSKKMIKIEGEQAAVPPRPSAPGPQASTDAIHREIVLFLAVCSGILAVVVFLIAIASANN